MDYTIGGLKRHHGEVYASGYWREMRKKRHHQWHIITRVTCYHPSPWTMHHAPSQQQPQWHRTTSLPFVSLDFDVFLLCGAGVCYHYRLPTWQINCHLTAITYTHSDIGRILNVGQHQDIKDPSSVWGVIVDINMEHGKSFVLRLCYPPFRGWY